MSPAMFITFLIILVFPALHSNKMTEKGTKFISTCLATIICSPVILLSYAAFIYILSKIF